MSLEELRFLSTKIGSDPFQIQGAGGNVSWKKGTSMHIKASGTHLKDALSQNIFVEVDLQKGPSRTSFTPRPHVLRPSIETIVHAQIEKTYVVHTHDLFILSYAILKNGKTLLSQKLGELSWKWIPYATPGEELADVLLSDSSHQTYEIWVLQNHGLLLASNQLPQIESHLQAIHRSLHKSLPPFTPPPFSPEKGFRPPADPIAHLLAFHSEAEAWCRSIFYPDQAVFLRNDLFEIRRGKGVALREGSPATLDIALALHARLLLLVSDVSLATPLPEAEVQKLRNWDAEKYRIQLQTQG